MKNNIKRVFFVILILFALLIGYLIKYAVFDSTRTVANPYNPRIKADDNTIKRGSILDKDGVVIAESYKLGDAYMRHYPLGRAFAHPAGYMDMGKSGLESIYNFEMQSLSLEIVQRINGIFSNSELKGNSIVTTLDSKLQTMIYDEMKGKKGAVVVIEPSTGKILAMVSTPDFDPNSVISNWSSLTADEDNSPLVNRATQGLYPPGSIFKILSSLAILENIENAKHLTYVCEGSGEFLSSAIRCMNNKAHGEVDMKKAFAVSCNCYFAKMIEEIGIEKLYEICERVGFNAELGFQLDSKSSVFTAEEAESLLAQTAIGQGKTLVTPLFMAMITSAVANDGVMMQPYIIDHSLTANGTVKRRTAPVALGQVFSAEHAAYLNELMNEVVTRGTGRNAAVNDVEISGKTGTAENATDKAHGWFVAFADSDDPKIAVSIIIEQADGTKEALRVANKIFSYYGNGY